MISRALAPCLLSLLGYAVGNELSNSLPGCAEWAERGDCASRQDFMRQQCLMSCFYKERPQRKPESRTVDLDELYALSTKTANGKQVLMEQFDVYRTMIYHAPRLCDGSTKEFYEKLEKAHALEPYALEIIVFPYDHADGDLEKCGATSYAIEERADRELKIHVMEPVKINGPDTHPIVKYLKKAFDMDEMDPNFTHKFKVDPYDNTIEMTDHPNFYGLMAYANPEGVPNQSMGNEL